MTIAEVAQREQISERQAQRYCREGFKGHVLPSVKLGKAWSIDLKDYAAWRVACGWETPAVPAAPPQVSAPPAESAERRACAPPGGARPPYPPYPMPADPNGVLTNCPHEHSCNHPHPLACQEYMRREAEKLVEKHRGNTNDEN